MTYTLVYGKAQCKTYATKHAAIDAANELNLNSFEVLDENDMIVYQEFPQARFV